MLATVVFGFKQFCLFVLFQIKGLFSGSPKHIFCNILLLFVITPLFVLFQVPHWIGFICDRIFFKKASDISINNPIFISGIPRSGTTFLQRTLSVDSNLTTSTLWDCLIAPSISQKKLYSNIAKRLSPIFSPIKSKVENRIPFLKKMDTIHTLGLNEAEEDFLFFLPIFSCFILVALFPRNHAVWKLSHPQICFSQDERDLILQFYEQMVRRHLFFYGEEKRYLSKNPSFTPWLKDLYSHFPEASFVLCVRTPVETIPSQVSSLKPALSLIGFDTEDAEFNHQIHTMLASYYDCIANFKQRHHTITTVVDMPALNHELYFVVREIYRMSRLSWNDTLQQQYRELASQAKQYRSQHDYEIKRGGYTDPAKLIPAWPFNRELLFNANTMKDPAV